MIIKQKTEETPVDALIARIDALRNEYNLIEWGDDWKGRQSSDAVSALRDLKFSSIMTDILNMKGVSFGDKWDLASRVTEVLGEIVSDANECGGKLVNGSCGSFCPDTVRTISSFWSALVKSFRVDTDERLDEDSFDATATDVVNCFGDYAYGEFKFFGDKNIKNKLIAKNVAPDSPRSNKRDLAAAGIVDSG